MQNVIRKVVRRPTGAAIAVVIALFVATSCSVYDASLLDGPASDLGGGGTGGGLGTSGTSGSANVSGAASGIGGGAVGPDGSAGIGNAGASGSESETGGTPGAGGSTGSGAGGSTSGNGGSGGTAGKGSAGGSGGTAAAGSAGGGTAGSGTAGSGGAVPAVTGCAKLSVPFDDANDKAHFVITLAAPANLTVATISMHLLVQAGTGGAVFNYVQDSGTFHFLGVAQGQRPAIATLGKWSTLSWDVGAEPVGSTNISKSSILMVGIEIIAQPSTTWTNPTVVFVDSINVTTPTTSLSFPLDSAAAISSATKNADAPVQTLWLNAGSTDTTAAGVTLSWQATCP